MNYTYLWCGLGLMVLGLICFVVVYLFNRKQQQDKHRQTLRILESQIQERSAYVGHLEDEIHAKEADIQELDRQQKVLTSKGEELGQAVYELSVRRGEAIEREKSIIDTEAKAYKAEVDKILIAAQEDFATQFKADNISKMRAAQELTAKMDQLKANIAAATELAKRDFEDKQQLNFYKLQLDDSALGDIVQLRELEPRLANKEILNKMIWKTYYEKPYTDMVGRVIGNPKIPSGIYKITNIETKQCYVGQAVNIAERWRQHIKRGLGAEMPTQNKLYPAMKKIGPENFTFEVIEYCGKDKLDAQEDYWQNVYGAKEFGYSIK